MKKNELVLIGGWIALLLGVLLIAITLSGCDSGWSIAGWEI